jgi:putative transposase
VFTRGRKGFRHALCPRQSVAVGTAYQVRAYRNRRAGGDGCAVDKWSTSCRAGGAALTALNRLPEPDLLDPCAVMVSRDPAGRWFVVRHVDVRAPNRQVSPTTGQSVGVDLDLLDLMVLAHGEPVARPGQMDRLAQRRKHYRRILARSQRGSANRARARALVAGERARVCDPRRDVLHQSSTERVRRFETVAVQDLAAAHAVKIAKLATAISGSGSGQFRALLTYQAPHCGASLVVVDRRYPSSKTCSGSGHLLPSSSLATRRWTCPGCGTR